MAGIRRFGRSGGLHSWGVTMFMFAWGFGSFCFYKIASALVLERAPNVLSCVVLAVITTGVIFLLTRSMVVRYGKWCVERLTNNSDRDILVADLTGKTLLAGAASAMAGWLVMVGFDPEFESYLGFGNYYYGSQDRSLALALGIFAGPTLANGAMGTFALYQTSSQLPALEKAKPAPIIPKVPPKAAQESPHKGEPNKTSQALVDTALAVSVILVIALVMLISLDEFGFVGP